MAMVCRWGALTLSFSAVGQAADRPFDNWMLQFEVDPSQTTSNTLQRPNNATSTRFDAIEYTGKTVTLGRLSASYVVDWWRQGSELRLDLVPLQQSGTRIARSTITYDGATFRAGAPLTVLYQFNTYRLTYAVPVLADVQPETWTFRLGGTLAIRDAQTRLKQPGATANFINYGPVPLLFAFTAWRLSPLLRLEADFAGFPAPGGGGLLDVSARTVGSLTSHLDMFVGVRYQAGGATDDTFFNFIHQRSALAGIRLVF